MASERGIRLPNWNRWLGEIAAKAASSAESYQLSLATQEWALTSALDVNGRDDFLSLPHLQLRPYPHQIQDAILFFRRLAPYGLIADEAGLEKRGTAGLIATELLHRGLIKSILIVTTENLMPDWQEELGAKFGLQTKLAIGHEFSRLKHHRNWITTYSTACEQMHLIHQRQFDFVILDQAHLLKDLEGTPRPSKEAIKFRDLMKDGKIRYSLMLTSNPIHSLLWDIYSLIEILSGQQPNPLGTPDQFRDIFVQKDNPGTLQRNCRDEFLRRIGEITLRTRHRDCDLSFPERDFKISFQEAIPEEKQFLQASLKKLSEFESSKRLPFALSLLSSPWAAVHSLRAMADELDQFSKIRKMLRELAERGRRATRSGKTDGLLSVLRSVTQKANEERVIIYAHSPATLAQLQIILKRAGHGDRIAVINDPDPMRKREALRLFNATPSEKTLLLVTDEHAKGMDLSAASILINYDLPWNPMVLERRIARLERLGQKAERVAIHILLLKGTVEEKILHEVAIKLQLFERKSGEMDDHLRYCGYESGADLERVILHLTQKLVNNKSITADLKKMGVQSRQAQVRLREMREATESTLGTIQPRDTNTRLVDLPRNTPRMGLRELIEGCLKEQSLKWREAEDGSLVVSSKKGDLELHFERTPQPLSANTENPLPVKQVVPGTQAFASLTEAIQAARHYLLDATGVGLEKLTQNLATQLEPRGLILESIRVLTGKTCTAFKLALKLSASVAVDQYQTLVEIEQVHAQDGVAGFTIPDADLVEKYDLHVSADEILTKAQDDLASLDESIAKCVQAQAGIERFCEFYESRFQEGLEHLGERLLAEEHTSENSGDLAAVVQGVARENPAVRAAYDSLKRQFSPQSTVEPVSLTGVQYRRVEI
ncbi:MAG: DEAD/DEAH box helicase, partial [Planctomycetota bacterium]